jgi:hypothetical protein
MWGSLNHQYFGLLSGGAGERASSPVLLIPQDL